MFQVVVYYFVRSKIISFFVIMNYNRSFLRE